MKFDNTGKMSLAEALYQIMTLKEEADANKSHS
jgi:hypothetical protein